MKLRRARGMVGAVAAGTLLIIGFGAAEADTGTIGPSLGLTANGHELHPIGRITTVGNFPTGSAVTPDSQYLWVADCGHGSNDVKVMSVASGAIVQTLPLPGCYGGIVIAPDGKHAYVGGTPKGSSPTEGPTQGDQGDVIHVFSVDPASGRGTETPPIALPATMGGSGRQNQLPPVSGVGTASPEGVAISADGATLVVALGGADKAAIIRLASAQTTLVPTGRYPSGVALDRHGRAYISNQFDGTLTVVDLASAAPVATIGGLGGAGGDQNSHPEGMAVDPVQDRIFVAVTNRDLVDVIDTGALKLAGSLSLARREAIGTAPVKLTLTPDGKTLYAADSNEDALAAIAVMAIPGQPGQAGQGGGGAGGPLSVSSAPSLDSIQRYQAGKLVAARALAKASARVKLPRHAGKRLKAKRRRAANKRRRAALKRYRSTLLKLRGRYLRASTKGACAGPTSQQVGAYTSAVLHALDVTTQKSHKARKHRRHVTRRQLRKQRAAARRQRAADVKRRALLIRRRAQLLAAAQKLLPPSVPCGAAVPGSGPGAGTGATLGTGGLTLIGRLPTAAYPTDVQVTPDGRQLLWVAGKGLGAGPNPDYSFDGDKRPMVTPSNTYGTYVLDKLLGRVGQLPLPTAQQIQAASSTADAQSRPNNAQARPADNAVPAPGTPLSANSKIKHVFYIVKENRTYDQIFGTDPRGNGAPNLELFDNNGVAGPTGGITPNAHALTRTFPLLDNFYADSEVSVDGHLITSSGYATDYVQKAQTANYSNRGRGLDFGVFPVTFPPKAFLFDQAARQGVSFRNYGEFAAGNGPTGNDGRSTYPAVVSNTDPSYPNNIFIGCQRPAPAPVPAALIPLCTQDSGVYNGTGKVIGAQSRVNEFIPQLQAQDAAGTVPAFNYMILPNDHTNGTTPNEYSPQALVADNDLALGQLVDAISHSKIWSSTAIVVVEDDSQDGADHVDAHRMPAYVISPWAKRGAVVHTRYDQYSALRTIELILGLNPLSLNDALATPMYDAFGSTSDPAGTQYNVVAPTQDIGQANGPAAAMAATSKLLPFSRLDGVPQAISDQILYRSARGAQAKVSPPGPNASPVETARALAVREALRAHPGKVIGAVGHGGDG